MRGKIRHMVLVMVAFCLLTGSVGMAATNRFCAMLGMTPTGEYGGGTDDLDCCSSEKNTSCPEGVTAVDQQSCCSISVTYHKLDVPSTLKISKVEMVALPPALTTSFLLPPVTTASASGSWTFYTDSSPPLAGRELLHRLSILNI